MTVENIVVSETYIVAGGNTVFPIPFDFFKTTEVKVYADAVLATEGAGNDYTLTDYVTNSRGDSLPTNVTYNTAPADGTEILVVRSSALLQEEDFQDSDPVPQEKFEDGLDKLTLKMQEIDNNQERQVQVIEGSALDTPVELPEPGAGEFLKYNAAGDAIESEDIGLTTINTNISTNTDDIATNAANIAQNTLDILENAAAISDNSDDIATNAANTANNTTNVLTNTGDIATNTAAIAAHNLRLSALELTEGLRSSQTILNNQSVGVNLTDFLFDGDTYDYIVVEYVVKRTTDTNHILEGGTLHIAMRGNLVWTFENGLRTIDIGGVTFSISTQAGNVGQLSYVSTNLAGSGYVGKMRYTIKKYEV